MAKLFNSPLIVSLFLVNGVSLLVGSFAFVLKLPEPDEQAVSSLEEVLSKDLKDVREAEMQRALDRPLFHFNRRKPQALEPKAAPKEIKAKIEAPYLLVGIMGSSETSRTAYLQHAETKETVVARMGDAIGDWQVDSIGSNFITLVFDGERRVIQLADGG
ncbi:MAG: hypothetical protein HWE08_10655 [Alphaproteobacteria bacterium]|nr:hypothetical protein [Alphaproteobacteria bacterium]